VSNVQRDVRGRKRRRKRGSKVAEGLGTQLDSDLTLEDISNNKHVRRCNAHRSKISKK
jgi:hypothetical protein